MYPTNQYLDPYYSHYRNHTPYPYYPPPGWEASHPRATGSSYQPPSYGPWSYNAGMHHPHPSEFHCCCNQAYLPGYYSFRPPFPQELPPPHLYYHGPFPHHPNTCPPYYVPPHPHPGDETPYGYDKSKGSCCGCPNHVCHGGEKSNVRIEEERPDGKPDREQKDAEHSSIIRRPNNQYPFVCLPPSEMEGKENGRRYELPPQLLNGWVPVDGKRGGNVKQQERHDQEEKQFQWPIVWMPARYDAPNPKAEEVKGKDESPEVSKETPHSPKIKIIPLSWFENGHHDQKPPANSDSRDHSDRSAFKSQPATIEHRDGSAMEGPHKTTTLSPRRINDENKPARESYKTIPVMPEKETDERKVGTYRTIPVVSQKESDDKKPGVSVKKEEKKASDAEKQGENVKSNHNESPTAKHSKLPPVCLRVDPLPRKKSGNGSSRYPSPPTRKDADKAKKDVSKAQSQNVEPKQSDTKKHLPVSEVKEKSPDEIKKGMGFSNETMPPASAKHSQEKVPSSNDEQKMQASTSPGAQENAGVKNEERDGAQGNAGAESSKGGDKSKDRDEMIIQSEAAKDDSKICREDLSEAGAAVRIQSAYRGYDVRRWQPLDKLRDIRNVHEQMQGVKKQLQSLEASSKKPTEKEQVAIGETIMNLLLKLDTIQGLHPIVREARKSVARELIYLQEKLDSLCKQQSAELNHTNNEDERSERSESIIQNAAPTLTAEASDEESKAVELTEAKERSSVDSMELCDAVPSEVSMEVGQDGDSSELKNQNIESCTSTTEVQLEEGKAAEKVEFQGASSIDMMSAVALPEHPADNHERRIEESNAVSLDAVTEGEKVAVTHEALESCTGDIKVTTAIESLDNGLVADNDGSAEAQMREVVSAETPELQHDVSLAEETQVVNLEHSSVSMKDAEPHEHDLTSSTEFVTSNVDEQPEDARDISMQDRDADSMQDSTKEPDGKPEASVDDMELASSADAERPDQAALLEPTPESDSVPEQTVLVESNDAMPSELPGKDDPDVDQNNEAGRLSGGELDIVEINHNLAGEAEDTRAATGLPEFGPCKSSCSCEDAITGYERPEMKVLGSQADEQIDFVYSDGSWADVQAPQIDECTEMLKEAPAGVKGANSAEEVDARVPGTEECNGMAEVFPVYATGVTSAKDDTDNQKEDVGVQTESKAPEEALSAFATPDEGVQTESKSSEGALSASATPDALKDGDEKRLAEENQKLRELLQKLLASGNDQIGVITDLSEKVKVLERKLARKKKPKVRVHRLARHATAKVH